MSAQAVVEARDVTHAHRAGGRPVLDGVSFSAAHGEVVVVEGRSGSGKSTLCQLLAGLEAPDGGTVLVDGQEAHRLHDWARIGLMPQRLGLAEELTVAENVWLPCWVRGLPEPMDLLESLDVAHLAGRLGGQVSRGEQQRVALARAAVLGPVLAVLDEPTSHQDEEHAAVVVDRVVSLAREGTTVVVASHDPQLRDVADQVVRLRAGVRRE
ncbi:ATP-binding cassette domain-containing protein [Nocardioides sp. J2M5]|uniref:ABC transporter ATP-binding protein n=1 Tax=Nocardioides palaemonis TaxID=2829810 RepID=UPI001BAC2B16|nr:ATP-binding cassette domain-containing protein [Nocardioides palaemonis]MBS2936517.1 ATP-binding cassette domain-containing protein [Nocardioides palaemonis]